MKRYPTPSWLVTLLLIALLAGLGTGVLAAGDDVLRADLWLTGLVQSPDRSWLADLASALNRIGSTWPSSLLVGVGVAGLLLRGHRSSAMLLLAAGLLRLINTPLKHLFVSPRPTDDLVRLSEHASGYGFPSGHSMGAVLVLGTIILLARRLLAAGPRRWLVQALALLLILGIGWARVYAGAHWPSDVLGGWLWGTAILAGLVLLQERLVDRRRKRARSGTERGGPVMAGATGERD